MKRYQPGVVDVTLTLENGAALTPEGPSPLRGEEGIPEGGAEDEKGAARGGS